MSIPLYDISGTVCYNCKTPIVKRMTMADGRNGQMQKGMIMICSNCLRPMILGDTTWRPMNRADFEALPKASQQKLTMTAKGLEGLLKEGKEWTPYGSFKKADGTN